MVTDVVSWAEAAVVDCDELIRRGRIGRKCSSPRPMKKIPCLEIARLDPQLCDIGGSATLR